MQRTYYYCKPNMHWKPSDVCDKQMYQECDHCHEYHHRPKLVKRTAEVQPKNPNGLVRRENV